LYIIIGGAVAGLLFIAAAACLYCYRDKLFTRRRSTPNNVEVRRPPGPSGPSAPSQTPDPEYGTFATTFNSDDALREIDSDDERPPNPFVGSELRT